MRSSIVALLAVAALVFAPGAAEMAFPATAQAADYVISDTSDGPPVAADCQVGVNPDTDCSLRDAVAATQATTASDRILLDPGAPYSLTGAAGEDANASGDLDVMVGANTGDLEITTREGCAMCLDRAVVHAAPNDRIFDMRGGNPNTFGLSNIIIENGSPAGSGGAVRAVGNGGNLDIATSVIRNNTSTGGGGAIDFTGAPGAAGARLSVLASVISGNNSGGASFGGAIRSDRETHITGNSAIFGNGKGAGTPALGGGVELEGPITAAARSTIEQSSIHDNRALDGAGVGVIQGHRLTLINSAIGENASNEGALAVGDTGSSLWLENATLANNVGVSAAATDPASIHVYAGASAADVTARNTIIATSDTVNNNCRNTAGGGAFTSLGNNIQFGRASEPSCAVTPQSSDRTVDPLLPANGTATANGMFFYLPDARSPAIDAGATCEANTGSTVDQLNQPRTQGAACDVGAVEQAAPPTGVTTPPVAMPPVATPPATTPLTGQRAAALEKCKKKKSTKKRKKCRRRARKLPV